MTKKAIAARRRYRAKKAGVPTRRRKPTGTRKRRKGRGFIMDSGLFGPMPLKGAGLRKRRRKRKGPKGAGFWEDVGHTFETIGTTALSILPMLL